MNKKLFIFLISLCLIFIFTLLIYYTNFWSNKEEIKSFSKDNLEGKNITDLTRLNSSIECMLAEESNLTFKANIQVFIKGDNIKVETNFNSENISYKYYSLINLKTREVYLPMDMDNNKMTFANIEPDKMKELIDETFWNITSCKYSNFKDDIFIPKNVCYPENIQKNPQCDGSILPEL